MIGTTAKKLLTAKSAKCAKALCLALLAICPMCAGETGAEAWLRYHDLKTSSLPNLVAAVGNNNVVRTAANELVHALAGKPKAQGPAGQLPAKDASFLATWKDTKLFFRKFPPPLLPPGVAF